MKKKDATQPNKTPTYEELAAQARDNFYNGPLKRREGSYDGGEPTWRYEVGALVFARLHTNGRPLRVEEVLDGGRTYHLSYEETSVHRDWQGGKLIETHPATGRRLPWFGPWYDLSDVDAPRGAVVGNDRLRSMSYTQQQLQSLVHSIRWRGINDTPEYQRDYVWTLHDKQQLIHSIFDGADIGKFVTMSHPYPENRLTIIDGKQRIRAILDFMEGRFEFQGWKWNRLSWHDRYIFADRMVQVCELDSERVSKSEVLYLFLQVNRGGVPQSEQHIERVRKLYMEALAAERSERP